MSFPTNSSIPPKIGEYAYYDSRLAKIDQQISHWIVLTNKKDTNQVACHYSLPEEKHNQLFITCHRVITNIEKSIKI